jgi:hypothetical protein
VQQQDLEFRRVRSLIGDRIKRFLSERLSSGRPQFHADELRRYVASVHATAPASADRILRALRQDGIVAYQVLNRRASLYEALDPAARRVA